MGTHKKRPSPTQAAVHEIARDLARAGFIDRRRLRQYEDLCLAAPPDWRPARIRALRQRHRLSQAALAAMLNTSLSTVRQWELGEKRPSGPSAKLLSILDRKGIQVLL